MFKFAFLLQYLLNNCMDSDQTYKETLFGGYLKYDFDEFSLILKVTSTLKMLKLLFPVQYLLNNWMDCDQTYKHC